MTMSVNVHLTEKTSAVYRDISDFCTVAIATGTEEVTLFFPASRSDDAKRIARAVNNVGWRGSDARSDAAGGDADE